MSLFGKKQNIEEVAKKWKRELRREDRNLDKTIRSIEIEEQKLKRSIKELAKKGDKQSLNSAKTLAKELLRSRKAKERLYASKAQLNSVSMQLTQNLSMMKVAGIMQKSTQVMGMMNNLVKLPQLNQVMMTMAREMEKAGLIEEIMDDAMQDDEVEEEAEEELSKVIEEITLGVKSTAVTSQALPAKGEAEEQEDDAEMKDLEKRLGALKE